MKPLTIEELKDLPVGEWVWIENIGTDWKAYYRVVYCPEKEVAFWGAIRQAERFLYSNYGIKWVAYKNKEQAEQCKNTCEYCKYNMQRGCYNHGINTPKCEFLPLLLRADDYCSRFKKGE